MPGYNATRAVHCSRWSQCTTRSACYWVLARFSMLYSRPPNPRTRRAVYAYARPRPREARQPCSPAPRRLPTPVPPLSPPLPLCSRAIAACGLPRSRSRSACALSWASPAAPTRENCVSARCAFAPRLPLRGSGGRHTMRGGIAPAPALRLQSRAALGPRSRGGAAGARSGIGRASL